MTRCSGGPPLQTAARHTRPSNACELIPAARSDKASQETLCELNDLKLICVSLCLTAGSRKTTDAVYREIEEANASGSNYTLFLLNGDYAMCLLAFVRSVLFTLKPSHSFKAHDMRPHVLTNACR